MRDQLPTSQSFPMGNGLPTSTALPTGTVTFLFTDIVGSTPLWERQPDRMSEALEIHNTALRGAIEAHRNEWTPEDTDELNEALRVRIDETLTAWLRQTIAERVHELRTELLEVAEGVITERIALLEARQQDDRATDDHG